MISGFSFSISAEIFFFASKEYTMRKAAFSFCAAVNSPLNSTLLTKYALCSQGRFFSSCMAKKITSCPACRSKSAKPKK